jgi:proline dehydrogenase
VLISSKPATDLAFNMSVSTLISTLAAQLSGPRPDLALTVFFGTHNPDSVSRVIGEMKTQGLALDGMDGRLRVRKDVLGKVFIAQLYGMKDDLMDLVVDSFEPSPMPIAMKYIAYGKLSEVMPFLGRRAIENKSLMSGDAGAAAERKRIVDELKRRYF